MRVLRLQSNCRNDQMCFTFVGSCSAREDSGPIEFLHMNLAQISSVLSSLENLNHPVIIQMRTSGFRNASLLYVIRLFRKRENWNQPYEKGDLIS